MGGEGVEGGGGRQRVGKGVMRGADASDVWREQTCYMLSLIACYFQTKKRTELGQQ